VRLSNHKGGFTETFETVATLPCRINAASANDGTIAEQHRATVSHVLYVEPTVTTIAGNDRLVSGERVFRVIAQVRPSVAVYLAIHAEEIQQ